MTKRIRRIPSQYTPKGALLPDENAVGKVRKDHPITSRQAALRVYPRTGTQRLRVLERILTAAQDGLLGATDEELQRWLGMSGNTERPRRGELVDGGWVYDTGEVRPNHPSTDDAIVWGPTPKAVRANEQHREGTMPDLPGMPDDDVDASQINTLAEALEYLSYRRSREKLQNQEDARKKSLLASIATVGVPDDKGSMFFYFNDPQGEVAGIKRERRVSQILDEDYAMALVEKYGLQGQCLETITVLNEDGLLAANFDGTIPDEEMKALYGEKETFALVLVKEGQ